MENLLSIISNIEIAENAIISKTILKNNNGNISLFALDSGQQISSHKASYDVLVVVAEGEINFSIENKKYNMQQFDSLYVPANSLHGLETVKKSKILIIMIKA